MPNAKEAKARLKINKMLEQAGWRFFDNENGKANISVEQNIKINTAGDDFENVKNGYIDYLLEDGKGFPLCVLEAKKSSFDPLFAKAQAKKYAMSQNVRFVILSNGDAHYLWDIEKDNPQPIISMPAQESLEGQKEFKKQKQSFLSENVIPEYIALAKNPNLLQEPDYLNPKTKDEYCLNNDYRILRPYQMDAIKAVQKAADFGQDRFLLEMATGLGKTLTAAALIQLFLRTANAKRVLFLVDRLELETQADNNFKSYLKDFISVIYKQNKDDWKKADVVVSTIQSLLSNNKYKTLFSPTDFDLVISDEAHRSIGANSRAVFEYFIGYKLGLTATPKDYLKNMDKKIGENDTKALELRILLDTYKTFGCESNEPTFRYSLIDGVKGGYLVNPIVVDVRTEITTQLLSDEGYSIAKIEEDGQETTEQVFQTDFEKKFFNNETNMTFCETFMKNALRDPISNEIGKSLIFCVSQNHCAKIVQILNILAAKTYPNIYNSDFAVQVTSNVANAQEMTKYFSNNNLNGNSRFKDGYTTSKTRVCVTVGMMTTGYDCKDILNLALMRPIFSPTDFVQIKGRGTRTRVFKFTDENGAQIKREKTHYKMFDYFAVFEYFEKTFKYDEAIELPKSIRAKGGYGEPIPPISIITINEIDPAIKIETRPISAEGMRIDREFWHKASQAIKEDKGIQTAVSAQNWDNAISIIKEKYENRPELFMTLEKIRKANNLDRLLNWREVLELIFGLIPNFKSRDELLEDECDKFISIYKPEYQYIPYIKNFIKAYIADGEFRDIIEKKEFAALSVYSGFTMSDLKSLNGFKDALPAYIKENIQLNTYM